MDAGRASFWGRINRNIGFAPLILAFILAALLYLYLGPLAHALYYAYPFRIGGTWLSVLPLTIGAGLFVLPTLIGALSRNWRGAIALATLPWWVVVLAHAGTLLTIPFPTFWLDGNYVMKLLLPLIFFGALGWLGWLARQAFIGA